MQSGDLLEAGIDRAADFGFFLGIGRVITIVGVTDEAILEAERVDGFRQTRGEGNDAANRLRNAYGAAGFVDNLAVERGGGGGRRRRGLCTQMRRCGQQDSDREADCESEARMCNFFGLCGTGGWPGLRLFSRLQWRDRGRFARPSPLPMPAN